MCCQPGTIPDNYIEPKISKHTLTGRWSSSDATALSEEGINNAERIAKMFKNVGFCIALSAYTSRTIETASLILNIDEHGNVRLREEPRGSISFES
ncbi:histidine phosphatase family protein [Parachlamydia acanthamoebae]|uniref:histidine phosphatase family protein n=1 Tax=Parachlamydia acanthamoebae TaxID=83552 RepID=UPI00130534DD